MPSTFLQPLIRLYQVPADSFEDDEDDDEGGLEEGGDENDNPFAEN